MIAYGANLLAHYTNMMWSDIIECNWGYYIWVNKYVHININKKDVENTDLLQMHSNFHRPKVSPLEDHEALEPHYFENVWVHLMIQHTHNRNMYCQIAFAYLVNIMKIH